MPAKKPRKYIKGIEHIQCCVPGCETWIVCDNVAVNRSYKCHEDYKAYQRKYKKNKKKHGASLKIKNKRMTRIEMQLAGLGPKDKTNFYGCDPVQKNILLNGTVNDLLAYEGK